MGYEFAVNKKIVRPDATTEHEFLFGDTNPDAGLTAPIGSWYHNTSDGGQWVKIGASDTDWEEVIGLSDSFDFAGHDVIVGNADNGDTADDCDYLYDGDFSVVSALLTNSWCSVKLRPGTYTVGSSATWSGTVLGDKSGVILSIPDEVTITVSDYLAVEGLYQIQCGGRTDGNPAFDVQASGKLRLYQSNIVIGAENTSGATIHVAGEHNLRQCVVTSAYAGTLIDYPLGTTDKYQQIVECFFSMTYGSVITGVVRHLVFLRNQIEIVTDEISEYFFSGDIDHSLIYNNTFDVGYVGLINANGGAVSESVVIGANRFYRTNASVVSAVAFPDGVEKLSLIENVFFVSNSDTIDTIIGVFTEAALGGNTLFYCDVNVDTGSTEVTVVGNCYNSIVNNGTATVIANNYS
jgi:hypothetical protein